MKRLKVLMGMLGSLMALLMMVPSKTTIAQAEGAAPANVKTISLATLAPPGSTWARVFDAWNRELRRRSNRTLQLRVYAGGVQGDEAEVIRKIRNGRLDAAAVTAVGLSQIYRPALVFQMPGIIRTYEQLDAARAGLDTEMKAGFEGAGFQLLGWADVGQSRVFSTTPIHTPAELATHRPWVWRDDIVLPEFFRVIHATPVPLQLPEVLGALQTQRVDTVITTPVAAVSLQWSTRVTHMMDMPLAIVLGGTVIGQTAWNSLTAEQKTIFSETAAQFHTLARRNLRRDEQDALRTLSERNIQLVPVTDAQKAQWREAATQTRARLVGQIADQALVDRVAAFAR